MNKSVAKKSLGQHFLVNQGVIIKIAEQVERQAKKLKSEYVVEIGPGQGALTKELLARGLNLYVVELDRDMVLELESKFSDEIEKKRLHIFHQDALKLDITDLQNVRVLCGNLPYNVGSAIVTKALSEWSCFVSFCFMLQKEVVEKFVSEGGKSYGPVSVRMSWMCQAEGHFWVKPGSFNPPPKVDSGVFYASRRAMAELPDRFEERMALIDKAFGQRRKMLRSTLKVLKDSEWAERRPEELTPRDFKKMTDFALSQSS